MKKPTPALGWQTENGRTISPPFEISAYATGIEGRWRPSLGGSLFASIKVFDVGGTIVGRVPCPAYGFAGKDAEILDESSLRKVAHCHRRVEKIRTPSAVVEKENAARIRLRPRETALTVDL
ncbi:MAG: hypothetical protein VX589_04280 [Myxococcota bacterium]|nr:hypothetical protein [Myxococcota bacterium]